LSTGYELFKLQRYNHLFTARSQHNTLVITIITISREPAQQGRSPTTLEITSAIV